MTVLIAIGRQRDNCCSNYCASSRKGERPAPRPEQYPLELRPLFEGPFYCDPSEDCLLKMRIPCIASTAFGVSGPHGGGEAPRSPSEGLLFCRNEKALRTLVTMGGAVGTGSTSVALVLKRGGTLRRSRLDHRRDNENIMTVLQTHHDLHQSFLSTSQRDAMPFAREYSLSHLV